MKWETNIAKSDENDTVIRGYPLEELINEKTFTEAIYLVLKGELPTNEHKRVLNAILVSCIDHGTAPPSVIAARCVASGGNSMNVGVAAGISALGEYHGGAITNAAHLLEDKPEPTSVVTRALENENRLPGYGHKIYTEDPRTQELFRIARNTGVYGEYCRTARAISDELSEKKGTRLCLNVDGAIAALLLEMQFPPTIGKAFFIISRAAGLCGHVHEEQTQEPPVRRAKNTKYNGPSKRHID